MTSVCGGMSSMGVGETGGECEQIEGTRKAISCFSIVKAYEGVEIQMHRF